jgi:hypothetical protein
MMAMRSPRRVALAKLRLKERPSDRIERAERFVHQQDRRIGGKCSRDPDALALTAGELTRITVEHLLRFEADQLQQLFSPPDDPGAIPAEQVRHRSDILRDGHMREKADLLNHISYVSAQGHRIHVGHILAIDEDPACRRVDQSVHHTHRRGFAAP